MSETKFERMSSVTLEEANELVEASCQILELGNKPRTIDEKMFRENLLPIFLRQDLRDYIKYYIAYTGSPYLGVIVTRNGQPAYEVPAIFHNRFSTFNLKSINPDGYTEEQRRIDSLGSRSPILQKQAAAQSIDSIKGSFGDTVLRENMSEKVKAMWVNVFKENGIDIYEHYGLDSKKSDSSKENSAFTVIDDSGWDSEEL